ncbi:MAG: hypothetical protein GY788_02040 [bacterium]|nr:hypothetical protein [bacterium]
MHSPGAAPRKVFLATPSRGSVEAEQSHSLALSMVALLQAGIVAEPAHLAGETHVDDGRNLLVAEFLDSDCSELVFLDADVHWQPEDLVRLCLPPTGDIVAGVYPLKDDELEFPYLPLKGAAISSDGLLEVEGAPTGFMRIKRVVLERMAQGLNFETRDGKTLPLIFERTLEKGTRWGGDYAFCRAARLLGFSAFVIPDMKLGHVGRKMWTGNLGDFLELQAGRMPRRFYKAIEELQGLGAESDGADAIARMVEAWGNPKYTAPASMIAAAFHSAKVGDGPVLETGSGLTTLALGASGAEVHTLESDPVWWQRVDRLLRQAGMNNVHLHYAPLSMATGWYNIADPLQKRFGLVVCDGPEHRAGKREPLWSTMQSQIDDAVWIIDDVHVSSPDYWPGRHAVQMGRFAVVRKEEKPDGARQL